MQPQTQGMMPLPPPSMPPQTTFETQGMMPLPPPSMPPQSQGLQPVGYQLPSTTPPGMGMGGYPMQSHQSLGPSHHTDFGSMQSQQSLGHTPTGEQSFHDPTQAGAYSMAESPHDVKLAPEFSLHVTKLLDIPIPTSHFSSRKQVYVVHVYDEEMNRIVATSDKINGHVEADHEEDCHTLLLGNEGVIKINSSAKIVHVELVREGFLGNEEVGQCTISRLDPRSPSMHRYALTHAEHGAHCGIELQVLEPKFNPKANIHKDPMSLPEHQRKSMMAPVINNGYVAMVIIDKVTDLPPETKGLKPEIFLSFEADEKDYEEHELQRSGPFHCEPSPHNPQLRTCFVRQATGVRAPLRVGGASGEGSMYLKVQLAYASAHGHMEVIGVSDPIQVRVMESPMQYFEIKPRYTSAPLGGVHLKHRLVTEDTWKKELERRKSEK